MAVIEKLAGTFFILLVISFMTFKLSYGEDGKRSPIADISAVTIVVSVIVEIVLLIVAIWI